MPKQKQIVIAEQYRIAAVFSEDQIQELIVATGSHQVGDIFLGVVENVLPGIDAAFVNIGDSERNGFIHVSDLGPLRLRRTAGSITELLAPQQKVLVQVMKEPTGNKGPRLTGNVSLPGRYLVLMPYGKGVNLSRRIRSETERNRLRALAILVKPAGMGIVVRTEAEGMPEDAIIEDLESLQRQWEMVLQEASGNRAPALLNRDDDFIQRVLRDVYSSDVNRIVVDSHTGLKRVKQHLMNWGSGKVPQGILIDHHQDRLSILEYFRINAAIREALKPRVDLPSGGYIIIERTEALTVIDVNSGSFTRSTTARETVLWTNCEAATEIARQLRLRNIAGVIVVDFIDMESRRDQLQVLEHFDKALRSDKARPQIAQLTELGLVELTRKRQGKNIYELFGRPCATCGGLGHLVHLPGDPEDSEGDSVERIPAAVVNRNTDHRGRGRGRDAVAEPTQPSALLWEDRSDDSDESGDLQELMHHPSYQELSGNNRRRRKRRGDEPPARDRNSKVVWDESRSPSGGVDVDPDELPADESLEARTKGGRYRGRNGTDSELAPITVKNGGGAPSNDDRRGRRRDPKVPAEPPELVVVEMTPEEQEVYAWMGISPLVLANQDIKNPRSAIVSIVLPGQAPPRPLIVPTLPVTEEESTDVEESETPSALQELVPIPEADISTDELSPVEMLLETISEESSLIESEQAANTASDNRRRRRRSSAATE